MMHIDPEDILRRELRAAAELIEPAADGLTQIRARLSVPRPLAVAWLMVGWTTVGQPALLRLDQVFAAVAEWLRAALRPVTNLLSATAERLHPVAERLHPVAERLHPVAERLRPVLGKLRAVFTPHTGPGDRPSRYAWLRPALAMAAVVAVVVVGSFALAGLPHQISQVGESIFDSPTHGARSGGHPPRVNGNGQPIPTPGSGSHAASPSPSASCSPSPRSTPSPTPAPARTSPSPTPSPSPSPTTPSPTPTTPSPTPTVSDGGDSPPPSDSQSAQDSSFVVIAGSAHRSLVAKARPSPSATCTPSAS